MTETDLVRLLKRAAALPPDELERFLKGLPRPVLRRVAELWEWQAHGGQREPRGDWRVWLIRAGRGFGKTRAGAEWVWARARETPGARIALVGANLDDVRKVMVEGESGIARAARSGEWARWVASAMRVDFSTGAAGFAYSGERPDKLRGPGHHFAWCDELAKWAKAEATWDNLQMTMRLGERPRLIVTTTPRPLRLLKAIEADPATELRTGRTGENVHLPAAFGEAMERLYGGTRTGRQELLGELLEEADGALWTRALIERCRVALRDGASTGSAPPQDERRSFRRIVIGVDPPASTEGTCGIIACGVDGSGIGWVLGDHSAGRLSPESWARKVAAAAEAWGAHRVVAEANNGGKMVESVLRGACVNLPVKLVHASEGKAARAEPVAALFERGAAKLAGAFPELEDEMCGLSLGGRYEGPGRSPDRTDAMVWAMTELMLGRPRGEPRVRSL